MEKTHGSQPARRGEPPRVGLLFQPARLAGGAVSLALVLLLAPNAAQAQDAENDYAGTLTEEQREHNPYDYHGDYGNRDNDYYAGYDSDYGDNYYNYYNRHDYSAGYGGYGRDANVLGGTYYTHSWYDPNADFFDWWD